MALRRSRSCIDIFGVFPKSGTNERRSCRRNYALLTDSPLVPLLLHFATEGVVSNAREGRR